MGCVGSREGADMSRWRAGAAKVVVASLHGWTKLAVAAGREGGGGHG